MEGDSLRIFLLVQNTIVELAGKVELIITLTWETDDIRYSSCQRNVILVFVILGIIRICIPSVSPVFIGVAKEGIRELVIPFCRIRTFIHEESCCCIRSLEGGSLLRFIHTSQSSQPVLMVQGVRVRGWVSQFFFCWCAIKMSNLTIERCLNLLCGEWQADTFPGSGSILSILSIVHRLANIPGMVSYRKLDRGTEVVVLTLVSLAVLTLRGAFYEVEERGGIAIGIILENMMSVDGSLTRVLLVAECIVCDVVSLCIVADVIGSSIYQEVLAYSLLDA